MHKLNYQTDGSDLCAGDETAATNESGIGAHDGGESGIGAHDGGESGIGAHANNASGTRNSHRVENQNRRGRGPDQLQRVRRTWADSAVGSASPND